MPLRKPQVVGRSDNTSNYPCAFLWTAAASPQMKDLGTFGGPAAEASGINASGQTTGYATTGGTKTQYDTFRLSPSARLVYQSGAMWFAANNTGNSSLTISNLSAYLGSAAMPTAKSTTFGPGSFTCGVTAAGAITVAVNGHTYNPSTGKLS